jgi:SAM-dependent methyltransferase
MRADDSASAQDRPALSDLAGHLEQLALTASEVAYNRLTAYGFARRYVAGKVVADIGWEEVGFGSRLLAETTTSVVGLTGSEDAADLARAVYPAPNAEYRQADLPNLPYPEGQFDVVVAFGALENLEQPEDLVREARRVLKQDGVLLISVPDKRAFVDGRNPEGTGYRRGMYDVEFQELLGSHFGRVLVYRQGAVAGGLVFPISEELNVASIESAPHSSTNPRVGAKPPATRSVIAVCGDSEALGQQEPYLLLDRDRRVFDECEDRAEDVELLRGEVRQMQETEAQAFLDALRLRGTEIGYLRARIRNSDAQIHGLKNQIQGLKNQIRDMENSTTWRIFEPYRRLRARMDAAKKGRSPENPEGSGGDGPG